MTATTPDPWPQWNWRHLLAAIADVRRTLERAAPAGENTAAAAESTAVPPADFTSALESLAEAFQLSAFERALLLLCAGPELDPAFAPLLARRHGDPRRTSPTLGLALAVLPGAHWTALTPVAPLRRWRLIEVGTGESLVSSPLRIDERVLHFLCGAEAPDERLRGVIEPWSGPAVLVPSHAAVARRIAASWQEPPRAIVQLFGSAAADQRAIASAVCQGLGLRLARLRAADVPAAAAEREAILRLWEREAILTGAVLLLDTHEAEPDELARTTQFLQRCASVALVIGPAPLPGLLRAPVALEVSRPAPAEQQAVWRDALGPAQAAALNGEVPSVAQHFQLDAAAIRELAAATATAGPGPRPLWNLCRRRARAPLEAMAQRIETRAAWADLVLPAEPLRTLHEIVAHVRQRHRVYEDWGFATKQSRGLGISALFHGPSGTGKTFAAEILARELELDLFRIDLSAVVDKYIGETEKKLRRVFDAAEGGGAVLLFDEADALFGKRSEVKDSHDRYANIEVSYLLQRMETYRGLAILTTNQRQALDPAFLRRLRFTVAFPFPDAGQRTRLWQRVFPPATPTEGLEPTVLARLNVSGGHIRNIALGAAVLAAEADEPVGMKHLLHAARSECTKMERPPTEAELGGWR